MSTVAPRPPAPLNPALVDSEGYIDEHISRTRRALKVVDLAAGSLTLLLGLLAFVLVAGVIDHWVVPRGLGVGGRFVLFGAFVLGVAWYGWRQFVPLLRSINPVYAAHAIEQSAPSLKNSLLNALLFRTRREHMSAKVFHALEQQAAARLSAAPVDANVDRGALLRLGYALVAVVAVCALYAILSPKNLATSAGRVLAPWADIAAPSRVQIVDIQPGDAQVALGDRLAVSAEIVGASPDDTVRIRYSTADQSQVDKAVLMTRPTGAIRFAAELPRSGESRASAARHELGHGNAATGVQQDLEYWIEAGDARSRRFKLTVFQRPTIVVQRVSYKYPDYAGEPPRTVDNSGDVRGLEGTLVTLEAITSQPIKNAWLDFDADGKSDQRMTFEGRRASVSFTLGLRDDRRTPQHASYALRFTTPEGRTNDDPVTHRIEVTPDYPPEVRITQPEEPETAVHAADTVLIGVEARDPDFALDRVRLVGRVGEEEVVLAELLAGERHAGLYKHLKPFVPADAQLQGGMLLEYWAEAYDVRRPEANVAVSEHRRLRILDPDAPRDPQQNGNGGGAQQQGEGGQQGDGGQAGGAGGSGGGQSGENGEGSDQGGGAAGQGGEGGQAQDSAEQGQGESGQGGAGGASSEGGAEGQNNSGGGSSGESGQAGTSDGAGQAGAAGGEQSGQPQDGAAQNQTGQSGSEGGTAGGQNGGAGGEAGATQQERVSAAGDDDATAFDRIRQHLKPEEQAGSGEAPSAGEADANSEAGGASAQDAQGEATPEGTGGTPQNAAAGEQNADGSPSPNENSAAAQGDPSQDAASADAQPGAEQAGNPTAGEQSEAGETQTPAGADGAANPSNGSAAAGDQNAGQPGAPEASDKDPRDQSGDEGQSAMEGEAPTGDSRGDTESDARGDQSGDRAGGGNRGGGQQAENAGQGESGSHTPSDTGANQSADQGPGESGDNAGNQELSPGETGQSSGDTPGEGSQSREAGEQPGDSGASEAGDGAQPEQGGNQNQGAGEAQAGENQPGAQGQEGASGEQPGGQQGAGQQPGQGANQNAGQDDGQNPNQSPDGAAGDQSQGGQQGAGNSQGQNQAGQNPPGANQAGQNQAGQQQAGQQQPGQNSPQGNNPGGGSATPPTGGGTQGGGVDGSGEMHEPGGDDPNLAYADEQTDLVLERLEDQLAKRKVDPELLKSLGWTEDELRQFVDRWKSLKAAAEVPTDDAPDARRQLDAALRSLGLRPQSPLRVRGAAPADDLRDLNEGYRATPPVEYADRVRAYLRSAAEE